MSLDTPSERTQAASTEGEESVANAAVTIQLTPTVSPVYRRAVTRMVDDYAAIFCGRETAMVGLNIFLTQSERSVALLLAPSGRGKTALLIHWVARVQAAGAWTVIVVPISRRYQTAAAEVALLALAQALAAFHRETPQFQPASSSPDSLCPRIADYLRRPPPANHRLLLVIDGQDQAIGWPLQRDLL